MRLSVSTKIFLGFAVVILAFGSACAYTIYRMSALRESVTVIWEEVVPVSSRLRSLSRRLRAPEEFLALKRPSDAAWLQRLLPTLEPFEQLRDVEERLTRLTRQAPLAGRDRESLEAVVAKLGAFRAGPDLALALAGEDVEGITGEPQLTSQVLYERLIRQTVKRANEGQLTESAPETRATIRALRRTNRFVVEALRELAAPMRGLSDRAASDEKAATLAVILIASAALVLSLLMLIISQLTLAPIRRLREGARRIATGHYDEVVQVRSGDEIGQLAAEFNGMAAALRQRDAALARQREELLRSDRLATIGKLAAQITHEVRNPLLSIGLNAELLEEELEGGGQDSGEPKALLGAIQDEVQRLKSITEEYLRFARMPRPELAPVDVGDLVMQFLSFFSRELTEAEVRVQTRGVASASEGGPPPIEADADQLRQVLINIGRNAIDAMRTGSGARLLQITLGERPGGGVVLAISDTGPGLDPELADRVFEPFVTGKSGGTGLGLALTEQIIKEHGGTITVSSRLIPTPDGQRGTTFIIELPADAGAASVVEAGQPGYSQ